MANQNKLKAYVRYDGTGRVIAGGPILQRFKPAVGNWVEINANECCNSIPTTTTTTTQGGGVTPTAFILPFWYGINQACSEPAQSPGIFYSASSVLQPGVAVFTDAALTIPVTEGFVINVDPFVYPRLRVGVGGVLSEYICPTTTTTTTQAPVFTVENLRWGNTQSDACTLVNPPLTVYTTGPLQFGAYVQSGNVIYLDQALTQPVTYPFILSPGVGQLFDCSNGLLSNQRSC